MLRFHRFGIGLGVGLVMDGKSKSGPWKIYRNFQGDHDIIYIYYVDVFPSIFPRWNLEAF